MTFLRRNCFHTLWLGVHVDLVEVGQIEVETDCTDYSGSEVEWVHMEGEVWVLMFQPGKRKLIIS